MIPLTRPVEWAKTSAAFRKRYPTPAHLPADRFITLLKYDGVCGIGVFEPGQQPRMVSRTGEDYSVSCDKLLAFGQEAVRNAGWADRTVFLMGEVWRPDCPQPTISGDFRQQRRVIEDFEWRLFDCVRDPAPVMYEERRGDLARLLAHASLGSGLRPAYTAAAGDPERIARTLGPGYDGLVVWDLEGMPLDDAKATGGQAIKFKPNITVDVRCTGGGLGEGKHADRLGYLTYSMKSGATGSVGTGFSDQQRTDFWDTLRLGLGVAGDIFEVEAMGYTPDGNLREPRFKGFRFDKTESD